MKLNTSFVEVKNIDGKSQPVSLRNQKPLKLLNPRTHNTICHLITTNYGGGLVQGDRVELHVKTGPETKTLLSSQANARVYKTEFDNGCYLVQHTEVADNACFVQLNDPLVLQADSLLEQSSKYELKSDSVLFLLDWVEAGRVLTGEVFNFKRYKSDTKIFLENKPVVIDRFVLEPEKIDCSSPAVFLNHTSFINIYLVGSEENEMVQTMEEALFAEVDKWVSLNTKERPEVLLSADRINQQVFTVRVSATEVKKLWEFVKTFSDCFNSKVLLGFNPYDRKY